MLKIDAKRDVTEQQMAVKHKNSSFQTLDLQLSHTNWLLDMPDTYILIVKRLLNIPILTPMKWIVILSSRDHVLLWKCNLFKSIQICYKKIVKTRFLWNFMSVERLKKA